MIIQTAIPNNHAPLSGEAIDVLTHATPIDVLETATPTDVLSSLNIELVMRTSSGKEYAFDSNLLTPAQKDRLDEILGTMAEGTSFFEINLTDLIAHADKHPAEFRPSETAEIQELRELVRLSLGIESMSWNSYLHDQRGCQSGPQLFATRGSILTGLKIKDEDRINILKANNLSTNKPHTDTEKSELLERYAAGKELLERTAVMLENMKARVKKAPLPPLLADSQKTSIEKTLEQYTYKTKRELMMDQIDPDVHNARAIKSGAILLEALLPLQLDGKTASEKKEALKEKEDLAFKLINSRTEDREDRRHFEPILGIIPNPLKLVPLLRSRNSQYEKEIKDYAKDVSQAGLETREEYHLYGNGKACGGELFFIKLQKLVASDTTTVQDIEDCVQSSYFHKAFSALHADLREEARQEILQIALGLHEVSKRVKGAVPTSEDAKTLCATFDDKYQAEVARQFP